MTGDTVLVTGAGGLIGGRVARRLVERGHRVRATTRDASKRSAETRDLEWVTCDLSDPPPNGKLFQGVDRAFLLCPDEAGDPYPVLGALVEAAARSGVGGVVMMTGMGPDRGPTSRFRLAERELQGSGRAYSILRPNWFMQTFHTFWRDELVRDGRLRLPMGTASVSYVDARDVAGCAAALLARDALEGRIFTLTGAEALDHDEAVSRISAAAERPLEYEAVEADAFSEHLRESGVTSEEIGLLAGLFEDIREGHLSPVTNDVAALLGVPPRAFSAYAAGHREYWRGDGRPSA